MNEADNRPTFKVGETYAVRAIGDNDIIYAATVVRRTAKTVTFREERRGEYTCRICEGLSQMEGCEAVYPHGRHSMAPVFTADRTLDVVEGRVRVAVYGTLMRGEGNHRWAEGAEVVEEGTVDGDLYDTGWGYPAIADIEGRNGRRVAVEVLATDARGLARMDRLEGYPTFYRRERVLVFTGKTRAVAVTAWIYVMNELPAKARLIEPVDGVADWRKYRAGKDGR